MVKTKIKKALLKNESHAWYDDDQTKWSSARAIHVNIVLARYLLFILNGYPEIYFLNSGPSKEAMGMEIKW